MRGIAAHNPDTTVAGLADDVTTKFFGLGFGYDDGVWQISSEFARLEINGLMPDTDSAYLSVGRRFGAFTPYSVVGWTESTDDEERSGTALSALNTRRDEYSLGVRWDIHAGVALKLDWTHARGFDRGPGGLNAPTILANGIDSTNVYTFKIDSAF